MTTIGYQIGCILRVISHLDVTPTLRISASFNKERGDKYNARSAILMNQINQFNQNEISLDSLARELHHLQRLRRNSQYNEFGIRSNSKLRDEMTLASRKVILSISKWNSAAIASSHRQRS